MYDMEKAHGAGRLCLEKNFRFISPFSFIYLIPILDLSTITMYLPLLPLLSDMISLFSSSHTIYRIE